MRPEDRLQEAIWTYAQHVLPDNADFASIETRVGLNAPREGARRKARGVRAGEPDCRTIWQGITRYHELKAGSPVSADQKKRHAELRRAGAVVDVVKSVQQMHDIWTKGMDIPLRFHALTPADRDRMLAACATPKRTPKPRAEKPSLSRVRRVEGLRRKVVF